jgi:ribonuclease D
MNFSYIQSNAEATAVAEKLLLQNPPFLAIDTEFIRENTYFPKLSIVQIATPERVFILDALNCDIAVFKSLLENIYIVKVFHSCRQDLEIFTELYHIYPKNVFDLQVAAALLQLGEQVSLDNLYELFFHKKLDKKLQYCDWLERPLSEEKIIYAYEDAQAIQSLYSILNERMNTPALMQWHDAYIKTMENILKQDVKERIVKQFYFVPQQKDLLKNQYQAGLLIWRDQQARILNKPRSSILSNKMVENLAFALVSDKKEIASLFYKTTEKYPRALTKKVKEDLLTFIDRLKEPENLPSLTVEREEQKEKRKQLKKALKIKAASLGIPVMFLYDKYEINDLLQNNSSLEALPDCKKWALKEFFE